MDPLIGTAKPTLLLFLLRKFCAHHLATVLFCLSRKTSSYLILWKSSETSEHLFNLLISQFENLKTKIQIQAEAKCKNLMSTEINPGGVLSRLKISQAGSQRSAQNWGSISGNDFFFWSSNFESVFFILLFFIELTKWHPYFCLSKFSEGLYLNFMKAKIFDYINYFYKFYLH